MNTVVPARPLRPPAAPVPWASARLHRPLIVVAFVMALGAVLCVVGLLVDERQLLGQPLWLKPLKFCISIVFYAVTLAWMIGLAPARRRLLGALGNVVVLALVLEMIAIGGAAALGTTSHFNVSSPAAAAAWSVMAASIVVVWLVTVVLALVLFRAPLGDPARSLAIRGGLVIGLVGMALAFLMTGPTAGQLNDFRGIAGAHAVGVADGGAGLPFFGWSTEGGDLRVPHFIGMHVLQALPLLVIALEWGARRLPLLRSTRVRLDLVRVATVGSAALVGVVLWQALRGQSIVAPDALTLVVGGSVAAVLVAGVILVLLRGRRAAVVERRDVAPTAVGPGAAVPTGAVATGADR